MNLDDYDRAYLEDLEAEEDDRWPDRWEEMDTAEQPDPKPPTTVVKRP